MVCLVLANAGSVASVAASSAAAALAAQVGQQKPPSPASSPVECGESRPRSSKRWQRSLTLAVALNVGWNCTTGLRPSESQGVACMQHSMRQLMPLPLLLLKLQQRTNS